MPFLSRAALVLLANLIVASPAVASGVDAAGKPEARLSWRLGFGGATGLQTGYGLALGVRAAGFEDGLAALVELDVSQAAALARLAGLPVYARGWQLNEAEAIDTAVSASSEQPWYGRQWVWWTAGGLALAAAAGAGGTHEVCTGVCNQNGGDGGGGGDGTSVTGVGDDGAGCVNETCAVCTNGDIASDCDREGFLVYRPGLAALIANDAEHTRWLDAGTGHMGDLIAR